MKKEFMIVSILDKVFYLLLIAIVVVLGGLIGKAFGADWLCTEEASRRSDNTIQACGIGQAPTENEARLRAFENAQNEFKHVCEASSDDCLNHAVRVQPKRTSCVMQGSEFKCYRLVDFMIMDRTARSVSGYNYNGPSSAAALEERDRRIMAEEDRLVESVLSRLEK